MSKKKKYNYFKGYEKLAELTVKESELLIDVIKNFTNASALAEPMEVMHEYENEGDDINHDIFESVATDFMPPFDREDIVALAQALDDVLDHIDDALGHMNIYAIRTMPEYAMKFAEVIKDACIELRDVMPDFHTFKKNKKFKHLVIDLNSYEEEGDSLYKKAISSLYGADDVDPMHVFVWTRIFEHLEKCCDSIEHVANIMSTIIMKNA